MRKFFLPVLCLATGFVIGSLLPASLSFFHARDESQQRADTVIVTDTVTIIRPVPTDSTATRVIVRQLPVYVNHTDTVRDTVSVIVPISTIRYSGADYDAVVSGFEARLDSLKVYPKTVTIVKRPSRWNFSVGAGACLTPHGIEPGVTLGVSYTLFSF